MKNKIYISILLNVLISTPAFAQEELTRKECVKAVKVNHPQDEELIKYCRERFYLPLPPIPTPIIIPASPRPSSTSYEIFQSSNGQLFSIQQFKTDIIISEGLKNQIPTMNLSGKNLLTVKIKEGKIMELVNASPRQGD